MIGNPQLKKYIGKPPEWYYEKALAALAGTDPSLGVTFVRNIEIRDGHLCVESIHAVLVHCCGHFALPIYTFGPPNTAAIRAQAIYWRMVRKNWR